MIKPYHIVAMNQDIAPKRYWTFLVLTDSEYELFELPLRIHLAVSHISSCLGEPLFYCLFVFQQYFRSVIAFLLVCK